MSTRFSATTKAVPTGLVLTLAGELDSATAPAANQAVQRLALRDGDQLIVDLTGLTFCDSSGIAALIAARARARGAGATIALAAVPRHLTKVFGLLGLTDLFVVHPTAEHAQQAPAAEH
ncbi:STAS domain-containing protein [Lentzea flaviverrucosa]|uniref:Anti-sigma factor antagonist n=1 Tax=Lentzea flaviverrucosa TaxID=200379 RepID=A0A1H9XW74_9PSEU|nr:STAS domain-containing protein [Lentzea flaviverrucosa]RDI18429.1 anti-anti-sigma factor [Lentzea flaviverrucosa]SES50366.1 anti-anti-sigma factor [Lentzea flaviverrucosa]